MTVKLVDELSVAIKNLIEMRGDKVGLHTEDCVTFRKTHKTCEGCQYELGCIKQIRMLLTTFHPDKQADLIDSILAAKTVEGVLAISIPVSDYPDF